MTRRVTRAVTVRRHREQRQTRAHGGSEMAHAEHANFERIGSHGRAYYERGAPRPMRKSAAIIEKFSAAAHCTARARHSLVSPELERTGREADL